MGRPYRCDSFHFSVGLKLFKINCRGKSVACEYPKGEKLPLGQPGSLAQSIALARGGRSRNVKPGKEN